MTSTPNVLASHSKHTLITFIRRYQTGNRKAKYLKSNCVGFTQNCQSYVQSVNDCLGVGENSGGQRRAIQWHYTTRRTSKNLFR